MKIKSLLFIFLIFTNNFVLPLKECQDVHVNISEYDLTAIDKGEMITMTQFINNKKIFAFDYKFASLLKIEDYVRGKIFPFLQDISKLEKNKYNPEIIFYIWDKIKFESEERIKLDKSFDYKNNSKDIQEIYEDNITNSINEYQKIKEDKNSASSAIGNSITIASGGMSIFWMLKYGAKYLLSHIGETSVSANPYIAPISAGFFVLSSIVYMRYHNNKIEDEIEMNKNEIYKTIELFKSFKKGIINIEWIEKNIVLTALSQEQECALHDLQFYSYEGKKYRNIQDYEETIIEMVRLTCKYRVEKCNNQSYCFENLMTFLENKREIREGKAEFTQLFKDDCSLEKHRKFKF